MLFDGACYEKFGTKLVNIWIYKINPGHLITVFIPLKEGSMKKIVGIMAAALCCAGVAWSSDYQEMQNWLFESYVNGLNEYDNTVEYYQQKEAFYAFMGTVKAKVQQEYPVDPQLTQQVADLKAASELEKVKKLQELGVSSEQALFEKLRQKYGENKDAIYSSPEYLSFLAINQELNQTTANLMKAYNDEFQKRYEAAFVEAVKKFQENGATMK
jgi:hypothetical protein